MKVSQLAFVATLAAGTRSGSAFTVGGGAVQSQSVVRSSSSFPRAAATGEESATALWGRRRAGSLKRKPAARKASGGGSGSIAHKGVDEEQVRALFSLWNNALATRRTRRNASPADPRSLIVVLFFSFWNSFRFSRLFSAQGDSRIVAKRYAKRAVLLPTVSDAPRTDFGGIKDYFDAFLLKKPQGKIVEGDVRVGDGWAQDAGIYEFTMGATGDVVRARYTFVYVFEDNQWKIAHHHSSVMPEGIDIAKEITEDEVRLLFHLWNDALATLDSDAVAKRYAKAGVLLPTVSDTPRTDYESIKDYFDAFLLKKPQGTILESNVMIGTNWCQDAGIYEFDLLGDKVKARYSFVYKFEDGEWKIAHHHSSMMPEPLLAAPPAAAAAPLPEREVRALFELWNDALATLDPDVVAARYSASPCLLPTVSDVPRTDYASIKDYFVAFLEKKPLGTILESYVTSGPDWCMDDGIYEFAFGATGDKVKARYSFVYTKEGDEWKIAHHHSSQMPEEVVPKASLEAASV
ncbi:LOW QUALITY PROTEIN: hypothetical protein ACHAWF_003712 [Thalassiosira exigua]